MKDEYELLDLDDGRKLERFGTVSTVRPAPAARPTGISPRAAARSPPASTFWFADCRRSRSA